MRQELGLSQAADRWIIDEFDCTNRVGRVTVLGLQARELDQGPAPRPIGFPPQHLTQHLTQYG